VSAFPQIFSMTNSWSEDAEIKSKLKIRFGFAFREFSEEHVKWSSIMHEWHCERYSLVAFSTSLFTAFCHCNSIFFSLNCNCIYFFAHSMGHISWNILSDWSIDPSIDWITDWLLIYYFTIAHLLHTVQSAASFVLTLLAKGMPVTFIACLLCLWES